MKGRVDLDVKMFGRAPGLSKFPIDAQVWKELENYRVHYGAYEGEEAFISSSKLDMDVLELPGLVWVQDNAPDYFKYLIKADEKFAEGSYVNHLTAWNDIRGYQLLENDKKDRIDSQVSMNESDQVVDKYLGISLIHDDIKGDGFIVRLKHNVLIWEVHKKKKAKDQSQVIQKYVRQNLGTMIERAKGKETVVPGIVKVMRFPFSEPEWRDIKKTNVTSLKSVARKVSEVAPVFAEALEFGYFKTGLPTFDKAKEAWRVKYLMYLLSDIGWIDLSSLKFGKNIKEFRDKQKRANDRTISTLQKLNNTAGKPTSKVNTKVNISRKSRNQRGNDREILTYEERRQRNAKKRLDYYDDQTYMENHYVRYPSARQRHNDGGGWS